MPFIDSKITIPVNAEKKEVIKSELGKLISTLGKPESYLMVGINDNYDLWFAGRKLERGAYVEVSLLGNVNAGASATLSGQICNLFERELGIPGSAIYITYHPVENWGFNGGNF